MLITLKGRINTSVMMLAGNGEATRAIYQVNLRRNPAKMHLIG
jgi:hypothetical protein